VGKDGNDLPYIGGSAIIDYLGADLADLGDQVGTATARLDLEALKKFRERFAFHKDADDFELKLGDSDLFREHRSSTNAQDEIGHCPLFQPQR
jgi:predicted amidohydrolase